MVTKTKVNRTVMYSLDGDGQQIVHKLPWDRKEAHSAEKFEKLLGRGFQFEPFKVAGAVVKEEVAVEDEEVSREKKAIPEDLPKFVVDDSRVKDVKKRFKCEVCGKVCRGHTGLHAHMKKHEREKSGK